MKWTFSPRTPAVRTITIAPSYPVFCLVSLVMLLGTFVLFKGIPDLPQLDYNLGELIPEHKSRLPLAIFGPPDKYSLFRRHVLVAMDTVTDRVSLRRMQEYILNNYRSRPDAAYNMNVTASDRLPLDRHINDTRPPACLKADYDLQTLPSASVVVPFYNEPLSLLLRTVHSILNRTPNDLLRELILVDDFSSLNFLKDSLEQYVNLLPKVRIVRNFHRVGLIRARLQGASMATGDILVFLDAHTEVNVGWLEPLLAELLLHPDAVVQPFVDGIGVKTMEYTSPADIHRGSFTWDLRYVWMRVPDHVSAAAIEEGRSYPSVTLVGCAMAANRTSFLSRGGFDPGLRVWGGENIELSFRTWLCGGQIITVTCSRVGHVFRPVPYKNEVEWFGTWQRNLIRIAEVWMDDYKRYFYASTQIYDDRVNVRLLPEDRATLVERFALREKLKCRPFEWLLQNVIPELPLPPRDSRYHGEIMNFRTDACWEVIAGGYVGINYRCFEHKLITENFFTLTLSGLLLYRDKCVRFSPPSPLLKVEPCPEADPASFGLFHMDYHGKQWGQLKVSVVSDGVQNTWCLEQVTSSVPPHRKQQMPQAAPSCDSGNHFQVWSFTYRFDRLHNATAA